MASTTLQRQILLLASILQVLRAVVWFTCGVILFSQTLDPSIRASVALLMNVELREAAMVGLGAACVAAGAIQIWVGYHVSTWRKSRLWRWVAVVPALDALAWGALGARIDPAAGPGFALVAFVLVGLAALSAVGVLAGRASLTGQS